MKYVIGLDLGTSALKGLVLQKDGKVTATASSEYPVINKQPGYSEQDPDEWIKATDNVIKSLLDKIPDLNTNIEGISISGQMHGLVTLDKNKSIVRPAILWNDTRTTEACKKITEKMGKQLIEITNNNALEGFTLPKIVWMQDNESELWEQVQHIMLPKDYIVFYLTGKLSTDFSDAAGTLLLDVEKGQWSKKILDTFDINDKILPTIYNSTDVVGEIKESIADIFGIKNHVVISAGGADNACAAVGSGIVTKDKGMVSIGTSGVFLTYEEESHTNYEGKLHLFNHAKKDSYYSMGVTLAAGHSLNWFKNTFAKESSFDDLIDNIVDISPGADGLYFSPYIVGERTPYADSQIRGSFIGIDTNHTMGHFTRAVLEGVTFSLKDSQQLMEEFSHKKFERIVSIGGGAKSDLWLQMQADIFDAEIVTLSTEQGPGMGAAYFAMVASNWYDNLEDCTENCVSYGKVFRPNHTSVDQYEEVYATYQKIYRYTKPICHDIQK